VRLPELVPGEPVVVVGGPGMGKTWTLASVAEQAAAAGYRVVDATGLVPSERRPQLVTVDDVHLLPAETARNLFDLARGVSRQPVVFLFSADPRAAPPAGMRRHVLQPWSRASAAVLLREQPATVAGRLRYDVLRRANGNPRAVVELARAVAAARTPGVADTLRIQRRYGLAGLDDATRRGLLYAAARLASEPLDAVPKTDWAPAVAAGVIEVNRDLRFTDPLTAVACYDAAPAAERRRVHRDLAECGLVAPFERALHHAYATPAPDERIAEMLERAGRTARDEGRLPEAVLAAQTAAEMSTEPGVRARRYVMAVLAAAAAGDSGWVRELAAAAEPHVDDPDLRLAIAGAVAMCHVRAGFSRRAMDLLVRTARTTPPRSPAAALSVAVPAAVVAIQSGIPEHTVAVAELREVVRSFPRPDDASPELALIDVTVDPRAATRWAGLLDTEPPTTIGKHALAVVADLLSETPLAVRLWSAGDTTAAWPEAWPAMIQALIRLGRWQEASVALDAAEELDELHDLRALRVAGTALRGTLAALRGDGETARQLGEAVWPMLLPSCHGTEWTIVMSTLALAAAASGDHETAYRHYRLMVETLVVPHIMHGDHPVLGLAMAAQRVGRAREAEPLMAAVRQTAGPALRPTLDHATAVLDLDDRTEELYESVTSDPPAHRWPLQNALAHFHFGSWLRRNRRPMDARPHLAAAYRVLGELGAAGLAEEARVELRASGGAPAATSPERRAGTSDGWALLSPQQREVARLAAQGLRNREIAEQLRMSPRTVSSHLYNAYLRLGITARHQLRGIL
jgi:DNA-binding CsgD family transcriptional regulator